MNLIYWSPSNWKRRDEKKKIGYKIVKESHPHKKRKLRKPNKKKKKKNYEESKRYSPPQKKPLAPIFTTTSHYKKKRFHCANLHLTVQLAPYHY